MYTGLMYNDIFSKTLHIWHSGWDFPEQQGNQTIFAVSNGHVYPFGLDPGWHGADNALVFTNSYKMKMAVVLGVIHVRFSFAVGIKSNWGLQMTFSLCLQIPNHIRFKRPLDIYANFIPQIIFLESIFGYLVICIIYKWAVDWSKAARPPPSLLNMLIAMFLSPGTIKPDEQLYTGQSFVQVVLVLLAVICIPWMLCMKPYFQWKEIKKIQGQGYVGLGQDGGPRESTDAVLVGEEEGNGRAMAEDAEEEYVCFVLPLHPQLTGRNHIGT